MRPEVKAITLERLIERKLDEKKTQDAYEFANKLSSKSSTDIGSSAKPAFNANANANDNKQRSRDLKREILNRAQIVCTTLTTRYVDVLLPVSRHMLTCRRFPSGQELFTKLGRNFETVIIDEAAQAVELSVLIALRYSCKRCILVGDPQQLPATVKSHISKCALLFSPFSL